jgi:hypothetical protein
MPWTTTPLDVGIDHVSMHLRHGPPGAHSRCASRDTRGGRDEVGPTKPAAGRSHARIRLG